MSAITQQPWLTLPQMRTSRVALAVVVSLVVHTVLLSQLREWRVTSPDDDVAQPFMARLVPAPVVETPKPQPVVAPVQVAPKPAPRPKPKPQVVKPVTPIEVPPAPPVQIADAAAPVDLPPLPKLEVPEEPKLETDRAPRPGEPGYVEPNEAPARATEVASTDAKPEPVDPGLLASNVKIEYRATSNIADGQGQYSFTRNGSHYTIAGSMKASGFFAEMFAGRIEQKIEGELDTRGMRPTSVVNLVGNNAPENVQVNWTNNVAQFSRDGKTREETLPQGASDIFSILFSYAMGGPPAGTMDVPVLSSRNVKTYRYQNLGDARIETGNGSRDTVHIRFTPKDGQGEYEAWLDKDQFYLPVKLRFPVARGRVHFELIARNLNAEK